MAVVLHNCSKEAKKTVLGNLSETGEAMLKEIMEFAQSVSPKRSRDAHRNIAGIIQALHDSGEISLPDIVSNDFKLKLRNI